MKNTRGAYRGSRITTNLGPEKFEKNYPLLNIEKGDLIEKYLKHLETKLDVAASSVIQWTQGGEGIGYIMKEMGIRENYGVYTARGYHAKMKQKWEVLQTMVHMKSVKASLTKLGSGVQPGNNLSGGIENLLDMLQNRHYNIKRTRLHKIVVAWKCHFSCHFWKPKYKWLIPLSN